MNKKLKWTEWLGDPRTAFGVVGIIALVVSSVLFWQASARREPHGNTAPAPAAAPVVTPAGPSYAEASRAMLAAHPQAFTGRGVNDPAYLHGRLRHGTPVIPIGKGDRAALVTWRAHLTDTDRDQFARRCLALGDAVAAGTLEPTQPEFIRRAEASPAYRSQIAAKEQRLTAPNLVDLLPERLYATAYNIAASTELRARAVLAYQARRLPKVTREYRSEMEYYRRTKAQGYRVKRPSDPDPGRPADWGKTK